MIHITAGKDSQDTVFFRGCSGNGKRILESLSTQNLAFAGLKQNSHLTTRTVKKILEEAVHKARVR